jgi:hypothetical protein
MRWQYIPVQMDETVALRVALRSLLPSRRS